MLLPATVEDQNFALFNYVNELNGEIEMILKQIEQVSNMLLVTLSRISRLDNLASQSIGEHSIT